MKIGHPTVPLQTGPTRNAAASPTHVAAAQRPGGARSRRRPSLAARPRPQACGARTGFDVAKVLRFSRTIAEGTFRFDPEVIAERLFAPATKVPRGGRVAPKAG